MDIRGNDFTHEDEVDGDNKGPGDSDDDEKNSESVPSLETGFSNVNLRYPFAMLEMHDRIDIVESKVENSNAQVIILDSKFDLVLKSLSEIKSAATSQQD